MNLNDMTIPQLKEHADTIGVEYTSKIRKGDLIDLIIKRETEIAQAPKPLSEKGVCDCDSYEPCYGECCGGGNCSCSLEPKPLPNNAHRQAKREELVKAYGGDLKTEPIKGVHYRGRALGLKHYRAMGLAIGRSTSFDGYLIPRGFAAHMPNSERVQNYARSNCPHGCGASCKPKLTPRQMRRVRKNAHKHNEGFVYSNSDPSDKYIGSHSLLARTPEGMGIFHKFSRH